MSIENPTNNEEWAEHNRLAALAHGPDSHDCPEAFFCEKDPHCEYAQCDTCGQPNQTCVCDALYMRAHDK